MILIEARNIEKYYGDRLIFKIPKLSIYEGDRIGIVGANGAGKTTLMEILSGNLEPDSGRCDRYCEIGFIRQFSEEGADADGKMLKEFGLQGKLQNEQYSGGEQTRVRISNALQRNRPLLFADEPTSNLDYKGIALLKEKLWEVETLVIISHDRDLLDEHCSKIIEVVDGGIKFYDGNYSAYSQQSKADFERADLEYRQYREQKNKLEQIYTQKKSKAKSVTKKPKNVTDSEYKARRFGASKAYDVKQKGIECAAKAVQSRIDQLDVKAKPKQMQKIKLDFSLTDPPRNKIVISSEDLDFAYGTHQIFDHASLEIFNKSKTAVIGENGAGKSTLFNLIFNGEVSCVPKAKLGYFHQDFSNLDFNKTILDNVMESSIQTQATVRCVLARLLFPGEDVFKKAGVLSGGEKIKLSLAKLLTSDANVLLLDEPTNYLDIPSIEAVQELLTAYEGTLLFVSHDKAFMDAVASDLLVLEDKKIVQRKVISP